MGIQILNCDPEIPLPSHSNASLSNIQCIGVCVCACCSLILPVFLRCYFSTCSEECWVWKCWKSQQFMQSLRALQRAQRHSFRCPMVKKGWGEAESGDLNSLSVWLFACLFWLFLWLAVLKPTLKSTWGI